MSRIGAALSVCARSARVILLSNLINLSIILNLSRDIAARISGKASPFHISSRFSLFCLCTPAAIRMPINASSSASVKGWNVFHGGRLKARGNLFIRSLLKASHTLLPFRFVSRSMMSQISGLIIDLNNSSGVNGLLFAAGPPPLMQNITKSCLCAW